LQLRYIACMKTASLPSVRVEPELRSQVEGLLHAGESLSEFVETAVRHAAQHRSLQTEFLARGMASLAKARRTGKLIESDEALAQLEQRLDSARQRRT
jgi:hypothetical protein